MFCFQTEVLTFPEEAPTLVLLTEDPVPERVIGRVGTGAGAAAAIALDANPKLALTQSDVVPRATRYGNLANRIITTRI